LTRHQQGFNVVSPSGLPLTCNTRSEREPLGFPLSFAPSRYQPRTSGQGQVWNTDLKSRLRHHHTEPPKWTDLLIACDIVSHNPHLPRPACAVASATITVRTYVSDRLPYPPTDPATLQLRLLLDAYRCRDQPTYHRAMNPSLDALPKIGAPATRGLNNAGYTTLRQLAGVPRAQLAELHGVGPKAFGIIEAALEHHNLRLG
jgi:hypothetical protein